MLQIVGRGDPPLALEAKRICVFDYYTVPWEDVPAATPSPVMILARTFGPREEACFAWHLAAEREGIAPEEIVARRLDLERLTLEGFSAFVRRNWKMRWVHWGLDKADYGIPALAQRMQALGVKEPFCLRKHAVDLSDCLKRHYGDGYVAHRRLDNLIRLNQLNPNGLLELSELTAAYRGGDFRAMLRSLRSKVGCIRQVLDLFAKMELKISPPGAVRAAAPAPSGWQSSPSPADSRVDKESLAMAVLLEIGPNASQISQRVGVPRTTLLGWSRFRQQFDRLKAAAAQERERYRGRRAGANDFEDLSDD